MWSVLQLRVPFKVLLNRLPYYVGDLKGDPCFRELPMALQGQSTDHSGTWTLSGLDPEVTKRFHIYCKIYGSKPPETIIRILGVYEIGFGS